MITDWFGNTAICTSVFGDIDYHNTQMMVSGVQYFYITDGLNDPPADYNWQIHYPILDNFPYDNRRKSKIAKIIPHFFEFLDQFKYVIWIDGDMQINNPNFVPEILSYMKNGLVISPHFDNRDCAYGEATIRPAKYQNEPMDEQVEFYKSEGFPEHMGLYECGVMAREIGNPAVREMTEEWMEQNLTWSYQDQVSFPYVLWKTGFKPDVLPKSFRDFNWVHINAHKHEG